MVIEKKDGRDQNKEKRRKKKYGNKDYEEKNKTGKMEME